MNLTLDIFAIGARGDGIAEQDGRRYFVPLTLPGETVEAEPLGKRGEGTVARLIEVLAPSRHRETPPCPHFGVCGGCSLQHWRSDAYGAWKCGLIERALQHRGVDTPIFEPTLAGMPAERRRVDFALRRQGNRVLAGIHERASTRLVDLGTCAIAQPAIAGLLEPLRAELTDVLPDGTTADAIVNESDSGLDVLIRPHKLFDLSLAQRGAMVRLAERADLARLSSGDRSNAEPVVTRRLPVLQFGEFIVAPPPGAFLQATRRGEQAMRKAVADWTEGASRLADLFAGVGSLSLGLPAQLALFESDRPAVAAADTAARKFGRNRVTVERRDLFRNPLAATELDPFDALVLDPPRAGAAAEVAEIARSRVCRVVYASCDAASFARDASVLQEGGYRLEKLLPIDQFLWSAHVELIALFARTPIRSTKSKMP